jgi:hypothetical protein
MLLGAVRRHLVITGALSGGYRVTKAKGWARSETFTPLPNTQPEAEFI